MTNIVTDDSGKLVVKNQKLVTIGSTNSFSLVGIHSSGLHSFNRGAWQPPIPVTLSENGYFTSMVESSGGDLYIAGFFESINGIPANSVIKYTAKTDTWSSLGTGIQADSSPGHVSQLVIDSQDTIYALGYFNLANNQEVSNFVKWSAETWSPMPTPPEYSSISSIAYDPNKHVLYLGGNFDSINGVPLSDIAIYDIATESISNLIDGGVSGDPISVLSVDPVEGILYVGGQFNTIAIDSTSPVAANGLAAYNPNASAGNAWTPLFLDVSLHLVDALVARSPYIYTEIRSENWWDNGLRQYNTSSGITKKSTVDVYMQQLYVDDNSLLYALSGASGGVQLYTFDASFEGSSLVFDHQPGGFALIIKGSGLLSSSPYNDPHIPVD